MHSIIFALLAAASFLTGHNLEVTGEAPPDHAKKLYESACNMALAIKPKLHCPINQPAVLYTPMPRGLWGSYYRGTTIVFVNDKFQGVPWSAFGNAIVVHEMVHYILSVNDVLQGSTERCENEGMAWNVYNAYVRSIGREDLRNPTWWLAYASCDGPAQ